MAPYVPPKITMWINVYTCSQLYDVPYGNSLYVLFAAHYLERKATLAICDRQKIRTIYKSLQENMYQKIMKNSKKNSKRFGIIRQKRIHSNVDGYYFFLAKSGRWSHQKLTYCAFQHWCQLQTCSNNMNCRDEIRDIRNSCLFRNSFWSR